LQLVEPNITEDVLTGWLRNPGTIHREDDWSSVSGDKLEDLLSFLRTEVEGGPEEISRGNGCHGDRYTSIPWQEEEKHSELLVLRKVYFTHRIYH
jgi:hypothetical protein